MRQALDYGNRIVMLHQGRIMLDISGAERASMKAEDLLQLFRRKEGEELTDDQLLLD
jgi:putative ABC transport system ATP-binding protein